MNFSGNKKEMKQMSPSEQELFISMVKEMAKIEGSPEHDDLYADQKRKILSELHIDKIYDEYRPGDQNRGTKTIPWRMVDYQNSEEILSLNAGSFSPDTQFHKIGIANKDGRVEFRMVHPAISFMLLTYNKSPESSPTNGAFMDIYNEDYNSYLDNKVKIDSEIHTILKRAQYEPIHW